MGEWIKPREQIATELKDNDFSYVMYGVATAMLFMQKINKTPAELHACRFLDFGCGTGIATRVVAMLCHETVGYDSSAVCVQEALVEHSKSRFSPPVVYTADWTSVPRDHFDIVMCSNVLEHMNEAQEVDAIDKILSAMKRGGSAVLWVGKHKNTNTQKRLWGKMLTSGARIAVESFNKE